VQEYSKRGTEAQIIDHELLVVILLGSLIDDMDGGASNALSEQIRVLKSYTSWQWSSRICRGSRMTVGGEGIREKQQLM
jgi:hypothetical protein